MGRDWNRVDTGAPDRDLMDAARNYAIDHEPLITDSAYDSPVNPHLLHLHTSEGLTAETGRFDVRWTDRKCYSYHYTEGAQFNFRYDRHPRADVPDAHPHTPPDAGHDDAVPSPIEVQTVRLVTLAVLELWRAALESGDLSMLRRGNPP